MTLRRQFQLYILAFHLLVLVVAAWNYEALGAWFFAIELLVLLSALLGFRLINMALKPLDFVKSFSDLLSEHEFATRFSQV